MTQVPPTERRNPRTGDIDAQDSTGVLALLLDEDARAVEAARAATGRLAEAVDETHARLARGGRVHYFGAGASGRLARAGRHRDHADVRRAAGAVHRALRGRPAALTDSSIDREDAGALGTADAGGVGAADVAVGVTASARPRTWSGRCAGRGPRAR